MSRNTGDLDQQQGNDSLVGGERMDADTTTRIAPGAYQALREALPVIFWFKRPYETFLRTCLRDAPELLAGLDFGDVKRRVADDLVDRLMTRETVYRSVTLDLMLSVSNMKRFPD